MAVRMSHNKYYTTFDHRRGKQEVIIGAGVSIPTIRENKKAYTPNVSLYDFLMQLYEYI